MESLTPLFLPILTWRMVMMLAMVRSGYAALPASLLTMVLIGLLYNIYGDTILNLDFIPQSIYDMQSTFYSTIGSKYGLILDTRGVRTKLDWEIFAAATSSKSTQSMIVSLVSKYIGEGSANQPLSDLYSAITGGYFGNTFMARPVVGGSFAILALQ